MKTESEPTVMEQTKLRADFTPYIDFVILIL